MEDNFLTRETHETIEMRWENAQMANFVILGAKTKFSANLKTLYSSYQNIVILVLRSIRKRK